jgi:hypothetical protein
MQLRLVVGLGSTCTSAFGCFPSGRSAYTSLVRTLGWCRCNSCHSLSRIAARLCLGYKIQLHTGGHTQSRYSMCNCLWSVRWCTAGRSPLGAGQLLAGFLWGKGWIFVALGSSDFLGTGGMYWKQCRGGSTRLSYHMHRCCSLMNWKPRCIQGMCCILLQIR